VPIIVPCHRVLAGGRRIGGFSAPGGASTKERLLAMEGVRLGVEAPLLDLMDPPRKSLSAI
jgi:methylated-DNA-[protein]-cysteine S-methyltransferase